MSVPRDRVSYGAQVFPFVGLGAPGSPSAGVPFLPMSLKPKGGAWCVPFNAVLDTGSTHTTLPRELARGVGVAVGAADSTMEGAGADFRTATVLCDFAIVDAQFPDIHCWDVEGLEVRVAESTARLRRPVIGWDVLGLFEIKLDHSKDRIEVRLSGAVAGRKASKVGVGRR